jgi:hypothetical protein
VLPTGKDPGGQLPSGFAGIFVCYGGEVVDAGGLQFLGMPPPIPLKQSSYCC